MFHLISFKYIIDDIVYFASFFIWNLALAITRFSFVFGQKSFFRSRTGGDLMGIRVFFSSCRSLLHHQLTLDLIDGALAEAAGKAPQVRKLHILLISTGAVYSLAGADSTSTQSAHTHKLLQVDLSCHAVASKEIKTSKIPLSKHLSVGEWLL